MICRKCGIDKEENDFYDLSKGIVCKECWKERSLEYYYAHKDRYKENKKRYYLDKKDYHREDRFKRAYGISLDEYNIFLENQGGVCAICGQPEKDSKKTYLSVDHDHETGKVRGLLCSDCNRGLGSFKDSPDLLDKAKAYLGKE